eukprot:scaffold240176_cov39-Tisochrysis_lutea.AAC.2
MSCCDAATVALRIPLSSLRFDYPLPDRPVDIGRRSRGAAWGRRHSHRAKPADRRQLATCEILYLHWVPVPVRPRASLMPEAEVAPL